MNSNHGDVYDWVVFALTSAVAVLIVAALTSRWPRWLRELVLVAAGFRILMALARLGVTLYWYGRGDALRYYRDAWLMADGLRAFDPTEFMAVTKWWGTDFVVRTAALVLTVIGPSLRGLFVVFSMISFAGVLLIGAAFARSFPAADHRLFFRVILFWPSLVFWPSSVGKESIIILGAALVLFGFAGRRGAVQWAALGPGFALIIGIRPHIALMFGVALASAEWLAPISRWSPQRVAQAIALSVLGAWSLQASLAQLGLDPTDMQGIQEYVDWRSGKTAQGGSQFSSTGGVGAVPFAFVNVLLRPFPWEVGNPLIALSAIELLVLWRFVYVRRHELWAGLRRWRQNRMMRFALPVSLVLIVFYGSYVSNLGLLARQRVVILPFLFVLLGAGTALGRGGARRGRALAESRRTSKRNEPVSARRLAD